MDEKRHERGGGENDNRKVSHVELITHNKDKAILTLLRLSDVVENDFLKVKANQNLGDLVEVFKKSKRNLFPVVNDEGELSGILTLDDFKQILFDIFI